MGGGPGTGIYRSTDGGDTWQTYTVPSNQGRMTLALAPSNNDILYLLMADNGSGGAYGKLVNVYRTDDGGDSFTAQIDFASHLGPWLLSNITIPAEEGALDVLRERFLIGSPETVARRIREHEEALGNTHLVVRMQFPGTDPEKVKQSIRLLAEEVAPRFRDERKPSS